MSNVITLKSRNDLLAEIEGYIFVAHTYADALKKDDPETLEEKEFDLDLVVGCMDDALKLITQLREMAEAKPGVIQ